MLASILKSLCLGVVFGTTISCTTGVRKPDEIQPVIPDSLLKVKADSLFRAGLLLSGRQMIDSALVLQEQALSLRLAASKSDLHLAYSYWRTARLLNGLYKADRADEHIAKAIALAEEFSAPRDSLVQMYLLASRIKSTVPDDASAVSLAQYAERLASEPPLNPVLLRDCMMAQGIIHNKAGRFDQSIDVHRRVIPLLDSKSEISLLATMYFNIAMCFTSLEKNDSVMVNLNKALALRIRQGGPVSPWVASIYGNMGGIFERLGMYDSALHIYHKSLTMRRRLYGDKHISTAGAYESIGDFYHLVGAVDSALYYRQALLRSQIRSFNDKDIHRNPRPLHEDISLDLVDYLLDKASTVRLAAGLKPDGKEMLELSLDTYLLADSVYAAFNANLSYDDLKFNMMEAGRIPYVDMLEVAYQLFTTTRNTHYLQLAHDVMEHSRAVVLKDAIARADSFEELGLPTNLLDREKGLLRRRAELLLLLRANTLGESRRDSLSNSIIQVDREYEKLKVAIAEEQPGYLLLHYGKDVRLDRLSSLMAQKQSVWIQYFWAKDKIYILTVGPKKSDLNSYPVTEKLVTALKTVGKEITGFSEESISSNSFGHFTDDAYLLYTALVAPALVDQFSQKLVISPDGPLMSFPFEALITSRPVSAETDFRLDYLVEGYDISYQYSSSFLDREFARTRHGDKVLAMAHAASDPSLDGDQDLPGARMEITLIRDIMVNEDNRYLLQDDASERAFKTQAEHYNLLHLAVHGVADTVNAMESYLVFRTAGDSEDGKLFARELYSLDLRHADLAVLSACESGVGRVQAGEGIMSIARGFAYAGCPSLVVSLWKVSDRTSPVLMTDFYSAIANGAMIDAALADAKRSYLSRTNMFNAHPSFWAAFLAVGETAPVVKSHSATIATAVIAGMIAAFLAGWWLIIYRRDSPANLQPEKG
jgi:CHAT domain-containing protein